jgi:hypothetical protein
MMRSYEYLIIQVVVFLFHLTAPLEANLYPLQPKIAAAGKTVYIFHFTRSARAKCYIHLKWAFVRINHI